MGLANIYCSVVGLEVLDERTPAQTRQASNGTKSLFWCPILLTAAGDPARWVLQERMTGLMHAERGVAKGRAQEQAVKRGIPFMAWVTAGELV